jgi:predicted TIM-barrel fold metal-dependent hydrolase
MFAHKRIAIMPDRADAHIHLFEHGFRGSLTGRPGVTIDEPALYESLAKDHGVKAALVVAYEGLPWAVGNNAFVAKLAAAHDWIRPAAFVDPLKPPSVDVLEHLRAARFVGLTFYVFDEPTLKAVQAIDDAVWSWVEGHRWLVSINSRAPFIRGWAPILERHKGLRLVFSHLGQPPRVSTPPDADTARQAMSDVVALSRFPGTLVKLSEFSNLSEPGYDYPHRAAWPYVQTLLDSFGADRLVWGSDFTPSLDLLSFPQTVGVFQQMPFLKDADRAKIEGGNLLVRFREIGEG